MTKKTFLCLAALCLGAFTVSAQNKFTIEGTITGVDTGRLVVITEIAGGKVDTIGTTRFSDGRFILEGAVTEPVAATLGLEGFNGGFFLFAEPGGKYRAKLVNGPEAKIEGTQLMVNWAEYLTIVQSFNNSLPPLEKELSELQKANKFKSAGELTTKILELKKNATRQTEEFFAQHDGLIPAYIAYSKVYAETDINRIKATLEDLGEKAKASSSGRLIADRIERLEGATKGRLAPDFTLADIKDQPVKMSDVKSKIKILDFWASWCGPCRLNNPEIKQLYADFKDKGLEIIGISLDTKKENWLTAVQKDGLEWINVSSLKGWTCETTKAYGVEAVPSMFVLDENNRIIAAELRGSELREFVAMQLGQ